MKRHNFSHDGLTLSYLDAGGDAPVLIALPAHWMEGVTYAGLADALAPRWRTVALDQRGHGYSDHAPREGGYTRDAYLGDIAALVVTFVSIGSAARPVPNPQTEFRLLRTGGLAKGRPGLFDLGQVTLLEKPATRVATIRAMEQEGVHVVYGPPDLKVHAKVCLVVRKEKDGPVRYCHLSTGNYNTGTYAFPRQSNYDRTNIGGIHYCTLVAMVEGSGEENSGYSTMDIFDDGTCGRGGAPHRQNRSRGVICNREYMGPVRDFAYDQS